MDVRSHVPSLRAYSALAPVGVLAGALAGRGVGGAAQRAPYARRHGPAYLRRLTTA
jgi:hypothetical protein